MAELAHLFATASLDEILLLLFIATGGLFIKVMLYVGKNLADSTSNSINSLGARLDKLDDTLTHLTQIVMDFKTEVTGEINRVEMRVALAEKDIKHHDSQLATAVERRAAHREEMQ